MGIRPSFKIVIGVDDAIENDPRRVLKVESEVIQELPPTWYTAQDENDTHDIDPDWRKAMYGQEWEYLDSVLYNVLQHGEYCTENVVGLIIHEGRDYEMIFRALAAIDEKYMDNGCTRIPTQDPNDHRLSFKVGGYKDEDVACNRFVPSVFENMSSMSRMWWKRARFYLLQAGWDIPENQLRYLLVWDWS